jgi:hypothetical protein
MRCDVALNRHQPGVVGEDRFRGDSRIVELCRLVGSRHADTIKLQRRRRLDPEPQRDRQPRLRDRSPLLLDQRPVFPQQLSNDFRRITPRHSNIRLHRNRRVLERRVSHRDVVDRHIELVCRFTPHDRIYRRKSVKVRRRRGPIRRIAVGEQQHAGDRPVAKPLAQHGRRRVQS